jgi:hypothetical protein
MRRNLFTLAAAASAVLCVGVCVLWVRGYFASDAVALAGGSDTRYVLQSSRGHLLVGSATPLAGQRPIVRSVADYSVGRPVPLEQVLIGGRPSFSVLGFAGRAVDDRRVGWRAAAAALIVPDWSAAILAAAPLAGWLLARRRRGRRRHPAGHCPACGYDLRATPGRCPECGAVPAQRACQTT